jgi:integration host factor subunit alpha
MSLTKADVIQTVAEKNGFSKAKASDTVETLIEIIKRTLEAGEDVLISKFGKFSVNRKQERIGRNPATGEAMVLRSRRIVTFKCSGKLRDKLNS